MRKAICIIGARNGGSTIAGDTTLAGHSCRLFEFPEYADNIRPRAFFGRKGAGLHESSATA